MATSQRDDGGTSNARCAAARRPARSWPSNLLVSSSSSSAGLGFHRRPPHGGNHVDESGRGHPGHGGQERRADSPKGGWLIGGEKKAKEGSRRENSFAAGSSSGQYHLPLKQPGQLPTPPTFNPREIASWLIGWVPRPHAQSLLPPPCHAPASRPHLPPRPLRLGVGGASTESLRQVCASARRLDASAVLRAFVTAQCLRPRCFLVLARVGVAR